MNYITKQLMCALALTMVAVPAVAMNTAHVQQSASTIISIAEANQCVRRLMRAIQEETIKKQMPWIVPALEATARHTRYWILHGKENVGGRINRQTLRTQVITTLMQFLNKNEFRNKITQFVDANLFIDQFGMLDNDAALAQILAEELMIPDVDGDAELARRMAQEDAPVSSSASSSTTRHAVDVDTDAMLARALAEENHPDADRDAQLARELAAENPVVAPAPEPIAPIAVPVADDLILAQEDEEFARALEISLRQGNPMPARPRTPVSRRSSPKPGIVRPVTPVDDDAEFTRALEMSRNPAPAVHKDDAELARILELSRLEAQGASSSSSSSSSTTTTRKPSAPVIADVDSDDELDKALAMSLEGKGTEKVVQPKPVVAAVNSALHLLVKGKSLDAVKKHLDKNPLDFTALDEHGHTAWYYAQQDGDADIVRYGQEVATRLANQTCGSCNQRVGKTQQTVASLDCMHFMCRDCKKAQKPCTKCTK